MVNIIKMDKINKTTNNTIMIFILNIQIDNLINKSINKIIHKIIQIMAVILLVF